MDTHEYRFGQVVEINTPKFMAMMEIRIWFRFTNGRYAVIAWSSRNNLGVYVVRPEFIEPTDRRSIQQMPDFCKQKRWGLEWVKAYL